MILDPKEIPLKVDISQYSHDGQHLWTNTSSLPQQKMMVHIPIRSDFLVFFHVFDISYPNDLMANIPICSDFWCLTSPLNPPVTLGGLGCQPLH